jgi:hypothetical protein
MEGTMPKQEKTTDRNEITSSLYTLANIAHAEYHLIEIIVNNMDRITKDDPLITNARKLRKTRSQMMGELAKERPAVNGLWCVVKHLVLTEMHLWELYEKTEDTVTLDHAKTIHLMLDELLGVDAYGSLEACPRCETDQKASG